MLPPVQNDTVDQRVPGPLQTHHSPFDKNACLVTLILSQYKIKHDAETVYTMVRSRLKTVEKISK